ncbi:DUF3892 domain-containing protein [Rhodococcus sp. IEGM 1379]|uniref:DUF3892 domain-containing protein n=1 Tax=Rhodococcus sp. IEGM 1379 TaxID=3047086 RepID=UPI0032D59769
MRRPRVVRILSSAVLLVTNWARVNQAGARLGSHHRWNAIVPGSSQSVVGTVGPGRGRPKYLRAYADGEWNNNLLSLPTY